MASSVIPEYVLPSPLKISTYTMIYNLTHRVDLDILSRCIPIYEKTDPTTNTVDGAFISISSYSASNTTDYARGIIATKIPKKVFNNEITLIYKYWGFKQINLKIFSNGKLQMTGIIDPDFETTHIGTYLINTFKNMKYRIYINPDLATINNRDFIVIWNNTTQQLDYMRRNLAFQDLDYILQHGIGYNYKATDWQTSDQVKQILATYIAKADAELVPLEQLRMELLNTYEYPETVRMQLFQRLEKFKKIKKLEKKHLKYENKKFMDIITESVAEFIAYLRMYKTRIQQLQDTDMRFVTNIGEKYNAQIIEFVKSPDCTGGRYLDFDSVLSSCSDYKITNIAIELINSDYNNRFNNNLIKLNELLNSPEYNIYNYYKPDAKYAGIIAKYMYNAAEHGRDTTKYKEGKCYCAKSCVTEDKKSCISVSISIFRPGSIIITAGKDVKQLVRVYDYLNAMFKKHFATISYIDVHDNKDHFLLNEERKIMRKENLVYIKRANIRVGDSMPVHTEPHLEVVSVPDASVITEPKNEPIQLTEIPSCLNYYTPKGCIIMDKLVTGECKKILDSTVPKLDLSSLCVTVKLSTDQKKNKRGASAKK
jgi:hypothetical protein